MIKDDQSSLVQVFSNFIVGDDFIMSLKTSITLTINTGSIMPVSRFIKICMMVFAITSPINTVVAADSGVFNNKSLSQHELTKWEKKKLSAEFKHQFNPSGTSGFQSLGRNPWQAKKDRKQQHNTKMLQLSNNWGGCREFAYKQRGQCYARGSDAYTCERYYDARVSHCNNMF